MASRFNYLIVILSIGAYYFYSQSKNDWPKEMQGTFEPEFKEIAEDFEELLKDERQGLTMAILYKGRLVLNLYGGYADLSSGRNWSENTMTVAYSCTKLIGALAFATLASRKEISYREKVTKYWPQFGKLGKENLTVDDILNHRSGLIKFKQDFTLKEAKDNKFISKLIEESKPVWSDYKIGYHALTYGFLLDQLFQRVDSKKRTIQQFYEEEVRTKAPNGDFYLGVPKEEAHRIARITLADPWQEWGNYLTHPQLSYPFFYNLYKSGGLLIDSANSPRFLSVIRSDIVPYNNLEVLQFPSISALGVGTAAGFAHVIRQFWLGDVISKDMWRHLESPLLIDQEDIAIGLKRNIKHGFFYRKLEDQEEFVISFTGNGKQYIDIDERRDLVIVLMRNGLLGGLGDSEYHLIRNRIFEIIDKGK